MNDITPTAFDVVIVGGGMIGASLAAALQPLKLRVALVEAIPPGADHQPSFDERTTALSNGSRQVLTALGAWTDIAPHAAPIQRIHVSDRGRFGFARLDAAGLGLQALGFVAPNRVLGAALWKRLGVAGAGLELLCPATVLNVTPGADAVQVRVSTTDSGERLLAAKLLVAADGAQSVVRQAMGISAQHWDYGQTAIASNVSTAQFHEHVAYERFTPSGPLALLPLTALPGDDLHQRNRCGLIWTLEPEAAQAMLALSDAEFLAALQEKFGWRLGRFVRVGKRAAYPLALTQAEERIAARCVIIGNAAQGLHPIAGQGFNLGLRDVATLAETLSETLSEGGEPGSTAMLERYEAWRARDRRSIVAFTDGLVRVFGTPLSTVGVLRNLGLLAFDLLPPAKRALSRLSMGFASRLPRLTRGVPLQ